MVVLLTTVFTFSTVSGVQRGIKWLSELNVWLTLGLGLAILLLGPGFWILRHFISSFTLYLSHLPQMAFAVNDTNLNWVNNWTSVGMAITSCSKPNRSWAKLHLDC
ncbi:BCCT family transporter [cyanobiont of Ornithocercus magnificus]|nr:BCCT family transporter [cyanobiont of Ornithocercus magnificus]